VPGGYFRLLDAGGFLPGMNFSAPGTVFSPPEMNFSAPWMYQSRPEIDYSPPDMN